MRTLFLPALLGILAFIANPLDARGDTRRTERLVLEAGAWMIKPGFSPGDADGFRSDATTKHVDYFPVSPNALFETPHDGQLRHYTVATVFRLGPDRLSPTRLLGLRLASIGENWEIFINGQRIASEMHIDETGVILSHRSIRDLLLPLPDAILRTGDNTLVIHLAGDAPVNRWTENTALGFYKAAGYVIDDFDVLVQERVEILTPLILAVLFVFGFYAAVSYYYRPQERHHLHFGILSAALFFYYAARSHIMVELFADTEGVTRLEYASIMMSTPAIMSFLHHFFFPEMTAGSRRLRAYMGVSAGVALLMVALPFGHTDLVMRMWQISAIAVALLVLWTIRTAVALNRDYSRELLVSTVFLSVASVFDVVDSAFFSLGFRFNQFAILTFVASLAWVSAKRTLEMRRQTERLNRSLLEQENRLRGLFDAAFEAIVIHDQGVVIDCNPAFLNLFGLESREAFGKPLTALLAAEPPLEHPLPAEDEGVHEVLARSRTGETFHIQFVSKRHPYKDRLLDMTAIRDIHERKVSEERLKERNEELELMINAMAGREQRMNELQQQVDALTAAGVPSKKG